MIHGKLLIVSDDESTRDVYRHFFEQYSDCEATDCDHAIALLDASIDLVLLEDEIGLERLKGIIQHAPDRPVIVICSKKSGLINLLREGAACCIEKEVADEVLLSTVQHWLSYRFLKQENAQLHEDSAVVNVLRGSEEKYRMLMQNAGDAIFIADAQTGILIDANTRAEKLIGRKRDEIIGMHQSSLHPEDEADNYRELFRQHVEAGGGVVAVPVYVQHSDGRRIPAEISSGVADFAGRQVMLGVFRDITVRLQAKNALLESEERFRQLAENIESVFWIGSTNWRDVMYVSPAYEKIWGRSCQSLYDNPRSWLDAIVEEDRDKVLAVIHSKGNGVPEDTAFPEYRIVCPDGSVRWIRARAFTVRNTAGEIYRIAGIAEDITEHKLAEIVLLQHKVAIDTAFDGFTILDDQGNLLEANQAYAGMSGYRVDELNGMHISQLESKEQSLEEVRAHIASIISQGSDVFETRHRHKDGHEFDIEVSVTYIPDSRQFVAFYREITERKRAAERLRVAAATFETHDAIMITDTNGNVIRVNQAFQDITGYSAEEMIGKNPRTLSSGRHDSAFYAEMWHQLQRCGQWRGEIWDKRKSGQIYPKWMTITAVKDNAGRVTEYVSIASDITNRKQAEAEIHNLAFYDALTGLPNRRLLMDRLRTALSVSARNLHYGAVLFLDMDNFKAVNDTLGHDYGDLMLIEVAERIRSCIREADSIARLGGDEFVVLLEMLDERAEHASQKVAVIAEKIRMSLSEVYRLKDRECHSSPSIGVCLYRGVEESADGLLKQADMAMYQAKDSGRNMVSFFDPAMQISVEARSALEADLRHAVADGQLTLHYQIQVGSDGRTLGAEALVRWMHPVRGMVSPAQFIPIAEDSSLILDIGAWVLDTACRQLGRWRTNERTRHLTLAVNVSAKQFRQPDFVEKTAIVLRKHGVEATRLKLELTESVVLNDVNDVVAKMHALNALGVRLSLDDFGTGYSSLSYLKKLPLEQIKIDQSFVRDIVTDPNDAVMVKSIISMAHNFNLHVIAEGVETEAQLDFLKQNGCMAYQGYLFSRPVPIDEYEALLGHFC